MTDAPFLPDAQALPDASASSGLRGRPLSRSALYSLAENEAMDSAAFEGALRLTGLRPDAGAWAVYWFRLLTLCGALLCASGVIFFIAWNWHGLHHFAKFGILEGVIAAGALVAVLRGVDSAAGAAGLAAAGLCMGPLLAVFGQTYMSGAHSWELFRAWTCMLLPFALLGRQAGLWLLVWLTAGVWGLGFLQHMSQSADFFYGLPEFLLLQTAAVALWEWAARRAENAPGREWLRGLWLPRLMVFAVTTAFTVLAVMLVLEDRVYLSGAWGDSLFLPFRPSITAFYVLGLAALYFWYRHKRRDLFMLGCGVFSACAVTVAAMVRAELFMHADAASLLFWGVAVAGLTALCGKLLLFWQRAIEEDERSGDASAASPAGSSVPGAAAPRPSESVRTNNAEQGRAAPRGLFDSPPAGMDWPRLWEGLTERGLWPEGKARPLPPPSGAPWYINTMLSVGGWISALLLMAFLGFLLFSTLDMSRNFEMPLFFGGLVFLGIGAACSRAPGLFARQFGLANAIAGATAAAIALAALSDSRRYWSLPCLLVCLASFPLIRSRAYRYIAAVFGVYFLYALCDALFWGAYRGFGLFRPDADTPLLSGPAALISMTAFWAVLCALTAWGWSKESLWMTRQNRAGALPALLYGMFTAMLLLLVASLAAQHGPGYRELYHLLPPRAPFGLGAAAGFIAMVFLLGRDLYPRKEPAPPAARRLCLACALLTLPVGWYLPGVPLALLGFLISRHTGNKVMLGASALFLAAYLFQFYYNLETTLLHKSLSLAACGLLLLAAAALVRRFFLACARPSAPCEGGGAATGGNAHA